MTDAACDALLAALEKQRVGCAGLGSEFYATLLARMIADVEAGGPTWVLLGPHADAPFTDAYPLRVLGGVHRRVLAGRDPDLARHYPSTGGDGDAGAAWPRFRALLAAGCAEVDDALTRPPQTNEVGRAASMIGGFLEVARRTGLPLHVLEIGASAGCNLRFDRFRYEQGGTGFGPVDAPVRFVDCWPDGAPLFATPLDVRADAAAWVDARLVAPRRAGVATVVFHSVMWQYLPEATRAAVTASIVAAGTVATPDAPLAWLRLEPPLPSMSHCELRLTLWPGPGGSAPEERHLADAGFHHGPVHWHP